MITGDIYAPLSLIIDRMTKWNIDKYIEDFSDIINYFDLFDLFDIFITPWSAIDIL